MRHFLETCNAAAALRQMIIQRGCNLQLSDYPRPHNDNGRGVHWAPMIEHISDTAWTFWLDELKAMSITWVKLFDDGRGSALPLCKLLLAHDIMPIVRLVRPNAGISPLPAEALAAVQELVGAGVRYFESINEPDLPTTWPSGRRPATWLETVTENFLADAVMILDAGGLPALPAMAFSGQVKMVQRILDLGKADIFSRGVWVAIHNYALNRPLDYPFDPVNQEGRPLTQDEYNAYTPWEWDGHTFGEINRWREEGKRPGAEITDDPLCFNAYQFIGQSIADLLDYPLPVISSEGGAVVGWKDDRRYPRLSPRRAAEMTVQMNNFVATVAPPWYFAICHWLLANQKMDPRQPDLWESQAWYTDWWNDTFNLQSVLPVVASIKAMSPMPRLNMDGGAQQAYLTGVVADEAGNPLADIVVTLRQGNEAACQATSDATGALTFGVLPPGSYELFVAGRGQAGHLDLAPGEIKEITLTLHPLPEEPAPPPAAAERAWPYSYQVTSKEPGDAPDTAEGTLVQGQVVDENGAGLAGIPLRLSWPDADGQTRSLSTETGARDAVTPGTFQFTAPTDRFSLTVTAGDGESETAHIEPDVETDTTTRGWLITFRRQTKPQQDETALILGEVPGGRLGQELVLSGPAGELRTTLSEDGQFSFAELPAGTYRLEMQYVGVIDNRLTVAAGDVQHIKFPVQSVIQGLVKSHEAGQMAILEAETHHWTRSVAISPQGQFRFAELPPGRYHVRLGDHVTESVYLDGLQAHTFPTLDLRPPNRAAVEIEARAANGDRLPGQTVILRQGETIVAQSQTALSGKTHFEALLPGSYQIFWQECDLTAAVDLANDYTTPVHLQIPSEDAAIYPVEKDVPSPVMIAGDKPHPAGMAGLVEDNPSSLDKILPPEILAVPTAPLPEAERVAEEKPLRLYILFPANSPVDSRARLFLAQIYIRRERGGSSGFDPDVALLAKKVVLIGGEENFRPGLASDLRTAGCDVEVLSSDLFELEQQLRDKEQKVI